MDDFDQFVRELGEHANEYTETELHQLHRDVRKLVEILLVARDQQRAVKTRVVSELEKSADPLE